MQPAKADAMKEKELLKLVMNLCEEHTGERKQLWECQLIDEMLKHEWYGTLDERRYGENIYLWECVDCWWRWTRQTVKQAGKVLAWRFGNDDFDAVDIGGGIGTTTVQLCQMFPLAEVTCTNVAGPQCEVGKRLFKEMDLDDRARMVESTTPVTRDAVLAFELLEHVKDPVGFIEPFLKGATLFVDGSSFTQLGYGHWPEYAGGTAPKDMRRKLNRALRQWGWNPVDKAGGPKLWNNRPSCWVR